MLLECIKKITDFSSRFFLLDVELVFSSSTCFNFILYFTYYLLLVLLLSLLLLVLLVEGQRKKGRRGVRGGGPEIELALL